MVDGGARLLGVVGIVEHQQLDLPAVDAAGGIGLLHRQLGAVAARFAEIGDPAAHPAEKADFHRFLRAAAGQQEERKNREQPDFHRVAGSLPGCRAASQAISSARGIGRAYR